jgi:Kdo2-lipid IVA lauroyltransferase/acyltransferase
MIEFLASTFARLPLPVAHALGVGLGWLVYGLSPNYRKRLKENLAASGIAQNSIESRLLVHQNIAESGKAMLELPFVWLRPSSDLLDKVVEKDGWDAVLSAKAEGKGLIMLTPHLGSFELIGRYLSTQFPLTVLYRPPKLAWLEPIMRAGRQRDQAQLATTDVRGVRLLLKALKRGEALGILPDQAPSAGDGVWADFFNRPAYTMSLIRRLQQRSGAPIIAMYAERLANNRGYSLHFKRISSLLDEDDVIAARQMNAAMEDLIRDCPSQYLWSYNRYKVPSGARVPARVDKN